MAGLFQLKLSGMDGCYVPMTTDCKDEIARYIKEQSDMGAYSFKFTHLMDIDTPIIIDMNMKYITIPSEYIGDDELLSYVLADMIFSKTYLSYEDNFTQFYRTTIYNECNECINDRIIEILKRYSFTYTDESVTCMDMLPIMDRMLLYKGYVNVLGGLLQYDTFDVTNVIFEDYKSHEKYTESTTITAYGLLNLIEVLFMHLYEILIQDIIYHQQLSIGEIVCRGYRFRMMSEDAASIAFANLSHLDLYDVDKVDGGLTVLRKVHETDFIGNVLKYIYYKNYPEKI